MTTDAERDKAMIDRITRAAEACIEDRKLFGMPNQSREVYRMAASAVVASEVQSLRMLTMAIDKRLQDEAGGVRGIPLNRGPGGLLYTNAQAHGEPLEKGDNANQGQTV